MSQAAKRPHSADFLGDWRTDLWSDDYLALTAERLGFSRVERALDVGCGQGHWGLELARQLPATARMVGIDKEGEWIETARSRAVQLGLGGRVEYRSGRAEAIPFADASFSLVTCQTLLMHVRDARVVLKEMLRVLSPGGLLLLSEPNNLVNALGGASDQLDADIEAQCDLVRFHALVQRGKHALGHGDHSVGQRLPGYLAELGCEDIVVRKNEVCAALFPPYQQAAQQRIVQQLRARLASGLLVTSGDQAFSRQCYEAGGGAAQDFDRYWQLCRSHAEATLAAIEAGTHASAGGFLLYLIAARKPPTR